MFYDLNSLQKNVLIKAVEESDVKRLKPNACVACFGLFELLGDIVTRVTQHEALNHYEIKRFITTHSLPVSLDLVRLQLWLALIEKFPDFIDNGE